MKLGKKDSKALDMVESASNPRYVRGRVKIIKV
jgi:hypothetical protein